MKDPWRDLRESQDQGRRLANISVLSVLQVRIKNLVKKKHCGSHWLGKISFKKNPDRGRAIIEVRGEEGKKTRGIPLEGLPELAEASLNIKVLMNSQMTTLEKYSIRLEGRSENPARSLLILVELDEQPAGSGACGHALLHCHVGPDHDSKPEIRVPLPSMMPWDALDWVLSQIIPGWEPSPW